MGLNNIIMCNLLNSSLHSMQVYNTYVEVSYPTRCDVSGTETVHSLWCLISIMQYLATNIPQVVVEDPACEVFKTGL